MRQPIPLRYPGGKFYALNILMPFLTSVQHDEYREPFVGGGTVYFTKNKVRYNWLNDIDQELITTFEVMKDKELRLQLVQKLSYEVATRERWKEIRALKPTSELEIAYRYYYLNRTSFSGKMVSGAWGYRPKRSLPPERWYERILPCGIKLENVKLTSVDFQHVIEAPSLGNQTLLYLDPPYYNPPKNKHYRIGFTEADHRRLSESLKNTKHKFVLTYDDILAVRQLYTWANIAEAQFFYRVDDSNVQNGKRRIGFELIITNYKLPKQLSFQ